MQGQLDRNLVCGDIQRSLTAESKLPLYNGGGWKRVIRASLCFPQTSVLALVIATAAVDAEMHKIFAGGELNLREVTGLLSNLGLCQTSDRSKEQAIAGFVPNSSSADMTSGNEQR